MVKSKPPHDTAIALLAWYDRHARRLPWREPPGGPRPDPYRVWLSEIMLQQTTVVAAAQYFQRFLEKWPTVHALAAASQEEVLTAWAGLGYYARARNLHRCARVVAEKHGGRFPEDEAALLELPGIGPYTAAAVAAIAFDRPSTAVDGNVERVVARLFAVETPLPAAKKEIARHAGSLTPEKRPGDFAQAMMDLGATVCLPRAPRCLLCPLKTHCRGQVMGIAADLPVRPAKAERPLRRAIAFWVTRRDGAVLLRRRPEKGLLGGMMEVPSTAWRESPWTMAEAVASAPLAGASLEGRWRKLDGVVRHSFTHFHLECEVWWARGASKRLPGNARWVAIDRLGEEALPSVMRKIAAHALKQGSGGGSGEER